MTEGRLAAFVLIAFFATMAGAITPSPQRTAGPVLSAAIVTPSIGLQTASDSIVFWRARAMADSMQIEFLKGVNEQITNAINPYGVALAAMAVLFTAATVVAAFILWRQGADYRRRVDDQFEEHRRQLAGQQAEYRAAVDDLILRAGEAIDEWKADAAKLQELHEEMKTAEGQRKEEIEEEIRRLRLEARSVDEVLAAGQTRQRSSTTGEYGFRTLSRVPEASIKRLERLLSENFMTPALVSADGPRLTVLLGRPVGVKTVQRAVEAVVGPVSVIFSTTD